MKARSDCADAQSDLAHRCPHMPEDMFSHATVQDLIFSLDEPREVKEEK